MNNKVDMKQATTRMQGLSEEQNVPVMLVDGKPYAMADINETQQAMLNQIADLEAQLRVNEFKHQQLVHGRLAYVTELKTSLEKGNGSEPE